VPRATYLKAQSAFRTGDFNQSLAMARDGLRRWPAGDPGWKFRFVAAEDPIYLGHVRDAGAVLESAPGPSDAALQARLKMERPRIALNLGSAQIWIALVLGVGEGRPEIPRGQGFAVRRSYPISGDSAR
jgi:hypothetical protein